jgi:hypothetical protein
MGWQEMPKKLICSTYVSMLNIKNVRSGNDYSGQIGGLYNADDNFVRPRFTG